uniref:NADH-ubiquinone oxidoreductase chain 1 n=1 Tax=Amaga expatria TaxID=2744267 RepID=A0A899L5I3_9PLAT|nr:NADH dehydrogenase subunit 1 [Amaga expatria]QSM34662.1 NADH dehydrogenase subunit 1 [Amaga expatria]
MIYLNFILIIVSMLISVIFFTMLERKIMSYMQIRKGPNKVGFLGLITPICDSLKLIIKNTSFILNSNEIIYWFSPILTVFLLLLGWLVYPIEFSNNTIYYGFLFFLCISSLNVYSTLGSGWGSNSKYSLLGALRGSAQIISYEVLLVFVSLFPFVFHGTFNLHYFSNDGYFYILWIFPIFLIWLISSIAETNRSPFDFSEGESELVSGFNTEYGSFEFAFLFLGEYGSIILISFLSVIIFFSFNNDFINEIIGLFLSFSFIWFRSSFPRFRYDLLMNLAWCNGLIFIIVFFIYLFSF